MVRNRFALISNRNQNQIDYFDCAPIWHKRRHFRRFWFYLTRILYICRWSDKYHGKQTEHKTQGRCRNQCLWAVIAKQCTL